MRHPFAFNTPARRDPASGGVVAVERRALAGILDAVISAPRRTGMAQVPAPGGSERTRRPGESDDAFAGRTRDLDAARDASKKARDAEDKVQKDKTPENGERMAEAQEEEALRQHQYHERHTWPDDITRRETLDFWWNSMKRHKALKEAFRQLRREREAGGLTLLPPFQPPALLVPAAPVFPPVATSFAWRGWPAAAPAPAAPAQQTQQPPPSGPRYTPEGWSTPHASAAPARAGAPFFSPFGLPAGSAPVSAASFG
jgi:hypothetical protein